MTLVWTAFGTSQTWGKEQVLECVKILNGHLSEERMFPMGKKELLSAL